ncbi:MAG: MoxR family ATPase [Clostridiales bacterium]|nr:MoxR family ATPase [Clostridiales bacterium]MDY4199333.1 MoxR family ATPase [Candidatus Fimadaptatus sp.]
MDVKSVAAFAKNVSDNVSRVIVGKEDAIKLVLCAILARGHILLEDVPGTGKTVMAKSLAKSLDADFARIQFTPDLLPTDVTGLSIWDAKAGEFTFKPGPVFTNILLADEINRATPRTQSALLECMEERQVTESGVTRKLAEPFLVVATQNPVEIQGTFPLPEAQLDRFLVRLKMGYPDTQGAMQILRRFISQSPLEELQPVVKREEIVEAQNALKDVEASTPVMAYITALCERTRQFEQVQLGVSPRGMLALLRASQAHALVEGRDFVTPDDVRAMAEPVLAHRIVVRGMYGRSGQGELIVAEALKSTPVPTESPERA